MRCPRCGFENMPGLTTCVRCSSVMQATAPVVATPPRAGWTKHLRPIGYWLNRYLGFHLLDSVARILPASQAPLADEIREMLTTGQRLPPGSKA